MGVTEMASGGSQLLKDLKIYYPQSASISVSPELRAKGKLVCNLIFLFLHLPQYSPQDPKLEYFACYFFSLFVPPLVSSLLLSSNLFTFPSLSWSVDVVVMVIPLVGMCRLQIDNI